MRKLTFLVVFMVFLMAGTLYAQRVDAAMSFGTVQGPSATNVSANYFPQSVGGGTFIAFSGNVILRKNYGIGGEIAWRASQNSYVGVFPFRPIFWDINGVYAPNLGKRAGVDLMAGIGAESLRFYTGTNFSNFSGYTNYSSSNHFMGHFAGDVRLYVKGNFFIRPELHFYLVHNNVEVSGPWATRYAVGLGYSFGGER